MGKQLIYIDLFAGCGGLSLGLYNAGLKGIFAVERHPDAFQTLKHNLIDNHAHFYWPEWLPQENWDIVKLLKTKSEQLYRLRGKIDLIVGGPPCQGFSVAGRRQAADKRNNLIYTYLRFVEIVQPRALMFENVLGFTQKFSNSKKRINNTISDTVLQKLVDLGYTDARGEMVNFAEYGVPQRRQRFVVIATRENLSRNIFSYLDISKTAFLESKHISNTTSCQTAISDLEMGHGTVVCPDSPKFLSGIVSTTQNDFQKYLRLPNETSYVPNSHRYVNHTPRLKEIFGGLINNAPRNRTIKEDKELYGVKKRSLMVLDPNEPSPTITTIPDDFVHYSEPRVMTVRECARLQTFPDWFVFTGPYTTGNKERKKQVPRYTQVGNAVPPLFAEQLGISITKVLSDE